MVPSAEFVESAVICFYGASNVWLEHLSNPGGNWAANDLEHVSITLLFFGGGLVSYPPPKSNPDAIAIIDY